MASRRSALAAIGRQFRPLLDGWGNALATLVILVTACVLLPDVFEWSILRADWQPDAERCRALLGTGACWGVIVEKYPLILFGRYPFDQHWRPALACGLLLAALWLAGSGRLRVRPALALLSGALLGFLALLHGGGLGLPIVDSQLWGGLPLTLLPATFSCQALRAVRRITGMARPAARQRRSTDRPSSMGRPRSSTTASKSSASPT